MSIKRKKKNQLAFVTLKEVDLEREMQCYYYGFKKKLNSQKQHFSFQQLFFKKESKYIVSGLFYTIYKSNPNPHLIHKINLKYI